MRVSLPSPADFLDSTTSSSGPASSTFLVSSSRRRRNTTERDGTRRPIWHLVKRAETLRRLPLWSLRFLRRPCSKFDILRLLSKGGDGHPRRTTTRQVSRREDCGPSGYCVGYWYRQRAGVWMDVDGLVFVSLCILAARRVLCLRHGRPMALLGRGATETVGRNPDDRSEPLDLR